MAFNGTVTLPLLGLITADVDLAPFQYAPTNSALRGPQFDNGTSKGSGSVGILGGSATAGFYGLNSLYTSVWPWNVAHTLSNVLSSSSMVQIAGSTINSFGVFDYDATLPNPSKYQALAVGYYNPPFQGGMSTIGLANSRSITLLDTSNGPAIRSTFRFPSLLFASRKGVFQAVKSSLPGLSLGAMFLTQGMGLVDTLTLSETAFNTAVERSGHADGGVYGQGNGATPAYQTITRINGTFAITNVWTPPFTQTPTGLCVNPITGVGIVGISSLTEVPASNVLTIVGNVNSPPYFYRINSIYVNINGTNLGTAALQPAVLADPTDNAAMVTGSTVNYRSTMTPSGYFLLFISGYKYYFLITPNCDGYYRIQFNGKSSAAASAITAGGNNVGYGMDLNGNVWFGQNTSAFLPLLYSTTGLRRTVHLNGFPQLEKSAMACRFIGCCGQWEWEG